MSKWHLLILHIWRDDNRFEGTPKYVSSWFVIPSLSLIYIIKIMQWDGVYVRVWLLFWVKSSLHPWLYKQDLTSCDHITLGIAPFHFKETINFGLGKCFIFIKSSIIAGSVTPSDSEKDIYYSWSLPRPVYVPPCSLSALPTTPPGRSVITPCCRTLRRRKRWSPRNPWRRDGPRLPICWGCVGGRSWRSCWQ